MDKDSRPRGAEIREKAEDEMFMNGFLFSVC